MRKIVCTGLLAAVWTVGATAAGGKEPPPIACVAGPGDLPHQDLLELVAHKKGRVPLERRTGCLADMKGISVPAVLLSLPELQGPYSIKVAAPVGKTYFMPAMQLLDEALAVRRTIPAEELKRRGQEFSIEIFMEKQNADERYLLVFIDPDSLGKQDTRTSTRSQTAFIGTGYWIAGVDQTQSMSAVDSGRLTFSVSGELGDQLKNAKARK